MRNFLLVLGALVLGLLIGMFAGDKLETAYCTKYFQGGGK